MKKVISVLLCLAMLTGIAIIPTHAVDESTVWDGDPVVFIQGYTGGALVLDYGTENESFVWPLNGDDTMDKLLPNLFGLIFGIVLYTFGEDALLIKAFDSLTDVLFEKIGIKPDGTSNYDLKPYPYRASEAAVKTMKDNGHPDLVPEKATVAEIAKVVPETDIYVFNCDWRKGQVENAARLEAFIDEILSITGKEKVDIYGLSHGGQLGATYLFYYGEEGKVDNAVLNVPAIAGTTLVTELLGSDPVKFDMDTLVRFFPILLRSEMDFRWIADILPADFLNSIIKTVFNKCIFENVITFGSIWDFVQVDVYDELKAKYLDSSANANIIAAADEMHYNCMTNMRSGLEAAQAAGTDIYIMSNYGTQIGTGKEIDSDFVIDTSCTSGAYTAAYGSQLPLTYKPKQTTCSDNSHNHISPDRIVDASCAFLPENTWFIYGQYHGQFQWDPYSRGMLLEMLLTDNIEDIYSDPSYPQFGVAQNPIDGVYACFKGEMSGSYNADSKVLVIRNLSNEYSINIKAINAKGCKFDFDKKAVIAPGEAVEIQCSELTVAKSLKIEITYKQDRGILSQPFTRSLYFAA